MNIFLVGGVSGILIRETSLMRSQCSSPFVHLYSAVRLQVSNGKLKPNNSYNDIRPLIALTLSTGFLLLLNDIAHIFQT